MTGLLFSYSEYHGTNISNSRYDSKPTKETTEPIINKTNLATKGITDPSTDPTLAERVKETNMRTPDKTTNQQTEEITEPTFNETTDLTTETITDPSTYLIINGTTEKTI